MERESNDRTATLLVMQITTRSGSLNVRLEGDGPVIALTHGLGGCLENWQETAQHLSRTHRVLTWDVPGFGGSPRLEAAASPAAWARCLSEALTALEIPSAVIGGISMGGVVSQKFAIDHPQQTRALIPISTSARVGEAAARNWRARADLIEREGLEQVFENAGGPALSYGPAYREANAERIAEDARASLERNDSASYAEACRAVASYDYNEQLRAVTCPTLILQGLEDQLTPPGGSVLMSRQIEGSRLEMIEGCGHSIPTEKPTEMLALLDDFLASLP